MRILITGGNGFIARNIFEQLKGEHDISSVGIQKLDLLDSSRVFDYIKGNEFDTIIHTATYDAAPKHSTKDPAKVLENNLKMFFNITRCRDHFNKMIYFGSGAEYSRKHWKPKMKEDYFDQHVPEDQYGFSKYVMTKNALFDDKIYNLRLFGVFGKYDDCRTRFIPNACSQAALDLPIKINQNVFYDYLYVDDLVKIVRWFINNKPKKKVYNICSGNIYGHQSLAEKIIKVSGKNLGMKIEINGLGKEYSGDNSLLLQEMGGFEFTPIDSSIKDLYNWYEQNKGDLYGNN